MAYYKRKKKKSIFPLMMLVLMGFTYFITRSYSAAIGLLLFIMILMIIVTVGMKMMKVNRLKSSGMPTIDRMRGEEFEEYLAHFFKGEGYRVRLTPKSNDYGADLIIEKNNRIVIQAKRYRNKVGIAAVQQVIGAKAHYHADEAWVITNSIYSPQATKLAQSNNVRLINRKNLQDFILTSKKAKKRV